MRRQTNAKLAGALFLLYIVVGVTGMVVSPGVSGSDAPAKLAAIAQHAAQVRIDLVLGLLTGFIALTLAAALYGITRTEDQDLAILALCCRVAEGLGIVVPTLATLGLLWLAQAQAAAANASEIVELLLKLKSWNVTLSATFFAAGSTVFCCLFVRGRMIPIALAWLGVLASVLLLIALPLQLVGVLSGLATQLIWIPMAAFEIPLGFWLLIKGVV